MPRTRQDKSKRTETSAYLRAKMLEFSLNLLRSETLRLDEDIFILLDTYLPLSKLPQAVLPAEFPASCPKDDYVPPFRAMLSRLDRYWNTGASATWKAMFLKPYDNKVKTLLKKRTKNDSYLLRLNEILHLFSLSPCACECLAATYLIAEYQSFQRALCVSRGMNNLSGRRQLFTSMLDMPAHVIKAEMGADAPLRKYGFVDHDFDLSSTCAEFLNGLTEEPLSSRYFRKCTEDALELEAHSLLQEDIRMMQMMIRNRDPRREGVNLLLYGVPGSGKTALARSLGQAMGLTVYEINQIKADADDRKEVFRYAALSACLESVDLQRSLIIVDEADEMLNSRRQGGGFFQQFTPTHDGDKGTINELMDKHRGAVVWITNDHGGIDPSTCRRFDYAVRFSAFTQEQRQRVWRQCLTKHGVTVFPDAEIQELASRYAINAGGIDLAVRNVRRALCQENSPEAGKSLAVETVAGVLKSHLKLVNPRLKLDKTTENAKGYSLDGLQIKGEPSLADMLGALRGFDQHLSEGLAAKAGIRNMNLLMYGPPGSGKTEFAKYVARELGRPLAVHQASDLLDCYVGNTEKNIRDAFEKAQAERAILFLDEADSLLTTRAKAVRSWEVTQVNELLASMESFAGILLCATNFKENLDPAALRRFNLKVQFDYLAPEGCEVFYRRFLGDLPAEPIASTELAELHRLEHLTPGDFKVVWQEFTFLPRTSMTHRKLLDALAAEAGAKSGLPTRRVGFNLPS